MLQVLGHQECHGSWRSDPFRAGGTGYGKDVAVRIMSYRVKKIARIIITEYAALH